MTKKFYGLVAVLLTLGALSADAATFTATAEGNTITIFSQSDKEEICRAWVPFSYWHKGKREHTMTNCMEKYIVISEKSEVCNVMHKEIVNPKIEGPVEFKCD